MTTIFEVVRARISSVIWRDLSRILESLKGDGNGARINLCEKYSIVFAFCSEMEISDHAFTSMDQG
jgi:hypothetical protein